MSVPLMAAFFALGAIVASFIGVVAARLNTEEGIFYGRSRCDACALPLPPFALVPVLSYVLFGGRTHCCGTRMSLYAPLTELLLGGLFALSYMTLGLAPALPFMLVSLSLLLALALYDLLHQILPTAFLYIFVAFATMAGFFSSVSVDAFFGSFVVATLIGGSLALIHVLSVGRAMGLADAPLAFGLSLLVGPAAFPGFIYSFWIGAVVGIIVLAGRPKGSRMGVEVPFAPFLAAGFLLAYFTQWNPFDALAVLLSSSSWW